ncbi:MAG TPA: ABC transporter permease [Chloroflexota bacterium]|nr:ABC transporter permease [Chloroflexota bacterium]
MRVLYLQSLTETRLWLRRRETVFFSLLLPIMFLLFFGALYGHSVERSGIKYINYIVPGYAIFAVMAISLGTMTSNLAAEREYGILKRLGGTPLPRTALLAAKVIAGALLAAAVIVVLIVAGVLFYGAHIRGNPVSAVVILVISVLSFAAIGIALGGMIKPDSAVAAGNLVYLALSFLGGVFIPLSQFPSGLLNVAKVLPSEHAVKAIQAVWTQGEGLHSVAGDLWVVAAWGAAAVIIGARWFRWQ